MIRSLPRLIFPVQVVLLLIELGTRYDSMVRQGALALTNIGGTALLFIVARRFARAGQPLPGVVSWAAVAGIWFDAAGNFAGLYGTIVWWDQLAHFAGTAAVAGGVWLVLRTMMTRRGWPLTAASHGLLTISVTVLLSVIYEITEYLGDLLFATRRVTNLYDTADDLLWNLLAAVVVTLLFARYYRRRAAIDQGSPPPVQ